MGTRLPSLKPRDLLRILTRHAGFYIHAKRGRGSHYILKHPEKPSLRVTVSYKTQDLKRGTLLGILKEADLSVDEFLGFLHKRRGRKASTRE